MLFTPDDKLLVSLADTALRIEEIANGTEILKHVFPHPDNSPLLAMSPDGSTLAFRAGANSDKLYLWTWEAGEEPREFDIRRIRVAGLAFSADGKRLAANGDHDQGIHIWDVETGRILEPLKMPENVYPAGAALYTPDGATLITSAMSMPHQKGVILFWDAKTGRQLARIDIDEEVRRLAISRDASKLAAIARGTIRLWDVATRKELTAIDQGHAEDIGQIVDAGQGEMVTASHDRTIRIWDVVSGRQKRKLQHDRSVRGIALSPDGTRLTSSSFDDSVRVWEFATGKELLKLPGHGQVGGKRVVAFSSDRRNLYSFGDDLKLNVWDATTGQSIAKYEISPSGLNKESNDQRPFGEFFELTAAEFFPGGQQLLVGLHKGFHIFDTAKNAELKVVPRDGGHMFSAALSPDGRLLLGSAWSKGVETKLADGTFRFSAAKNHTVTIWDLATGNVSREVVLPDGGAGPVTFSQDGLFYAVSTSQPTDRITIYKTESGNERLRFDLPAHVRCLTFSRDGKRLITGLHDTTALVWDLDALAAMTR
jgi:WD40 repeat protein